MNYYQMVGFPKALCFLALAAVLQAGLPALALAEGLVVVNTVLSDNGDDDGFADTAETVEMRLTVRNLGGGSAPSMIAFLEASDPKIECITVPRIVIGALSAGELRLTDPFVFKVANLNRTSSGEDFAVTFDLAFANGETGELESTPTVTLDLDLDVSDGSGPTTFFEGFESGDFGSFTTMHLDEGLGGSAMDGSDNDNSDGYRCQHNDPDWINSNSYGVAASLNCYLGPDNAPDAFY